MSRYTTVYKEVEVEVDLDDFDTEDLVQELQDRNYTFDTEDVSASATKELLEAIWQKRRTGKDYDFEVDQLIYKVLGKVI